MDQTDAKSSLRLRLMLIVIGVVFDQTPNMLALASLWELSWTEIHKLLLPGTPLLYEDHKSVMDTVFLLKPNKNILNEMSFFYILFFDHFVISLMVCHLNALKKNKNQTLKSIKNWWCREMIHLQQLQNKTRSVQKENFFPITVLINTVAVHGITLHCKIINVSLM